MIHTLKPADQKKKKKRYFVNMEKPVNNDSVVSSYLAFSKCPLSNTLFFWLWPTTLLLVLTVLGDQSIT